MNLFPLASTVRPLLRVIFGFVRKVVCALTDDYTLSLMTLKVTSARVACIVFLNVHGKI
jgi:hypothetical protein